MSRLEKLTIVLFVDTRFDNEVVIGSQKFERSGLQSGVSSYAILQKIVNVWPNLSASNLLERSDGSTTSIKELSSRLKSGGHWGGPLAFGGLKIHVAELPALMQTIVTIEETTVGAVGSWKKWVCKFLCEQTFVQAWVADIEYDYWQNASDPLEYEAVGKSYGDIVTISNGLPFPLQKDIIDTSQNIARMEIKRGYVEAIGSHMWLGNLFWKNSQGYPESIRHLSEKFKVNSVDCDIIEVEYCDRKFDSDETNDVQRQLRERLYGIS